MGPAPGIGQLIFCIDGAGAALVWDGHSTYDCGMPYRQLDEKLLRPQDKQKTRF